MGDNFARGPVDYTGKRPGNVLARLEAPATPEQTRVAVVADPHVSTREEGGNKLFDETVEHLETAVDDIAERDVDAVLSVGDLTKDGERWNYDAVDDALAALDVPFYAVPGNHDVPKERDEHDTLPVARFADRFAPGGDLPFHVEVGGLDVIGLNSSGSADRLTADHGGDLEPATLDWLDDTLAEAEVPLVFFHHNLPPMMAQYERYAEAIEPEMPLVDGMDPDTGERLLEILSGHDADLVLTGHLHMPNAARGHGVRELQMPTTCSFPQAYVLLDVDETGTTVRMVPVADNDGIREGYLSRTASSLTAESLTAIAAIRLAQFPLVDERGE